MATSLDIGLSNLSLKTITLSFYSAYGTLNILTHLISIHSCVAMCKSSSLIFVLGFAFFFRLEQFSYRLVGVIILIFSGVVLMVATETHFVFSGLVLVLSASALGGLRWSLSQILLKDKTMGLDNPPATIYWLTPVMGATLGVISLVLEGWIMIFKTSFFDGIWASLNTAFLLLVPGVIAFNMLMSEF